MPFSSGGPFSRVMVDHLHYGVTRVWWELIEGFSEQGPWRFQLQIGFVGTQTALDWVDVGAVATDAWYLEDDVGGREPTGRRLPTHYRIILDTAVRRHVSEPAPIWGVLDRADWLRGREIIRKERLRGETYVGTDVLLLKRFRTGRPASGAVDPLTGEVVDGGHPAGWGTPFLVGYHPPTPLVVELSPETYQETRGGTNPQEHSGLVVMQQARVLAAPWLAKEDVLVDVRTDRRWLVDTIKVEAMIRGVPLVVQATLSVVARSNVIYRIPVDAASFDPRDEGPLAPRLGDGCVAVDHDYGGNEALSYVSDCCGIPGASVLIFTAAGYDADQREPDDAVARSMTTDGGRWAWAVRLDPGEYVLVFERPGEFGPDVVRVVVADPGVSSQSASVDQVERFWR